MLWKAQEIYISKVVLGNKHLLCSESEWKQMNGHHWKKFLYLNTFPSVIESKLQFETQSSFEKTPPPP